MEFIDYDYLYKKHNLSVKDYVNFFINSVYIYDEKEDNEYVLKTLSKLLSFMRTSYRKNFCVLSLDTTRDDAFIIDIDKFIGLHIQNTTYTPNLNSINSYWLINSTMYTPGEVIENVNDNKLFPLLKILFTDFKVDLSPNYFDVYMKMFETNNIFTKEKELFDNKKMLIKMNKMLDICK